MQGIQVYVLQQLFVNRQNYLHNGFEKLKSDQK